MLSLDDEEGLQDQPSDDETYNPDEDVILDVYEEVIPSAS